MYMTCEICGNKFETKSVNALYCKECKVRKIPQEERVCAVCGKVFSCNISARKKFASFVVQHLCALEMLNVAVLCAGQRIY